MNKLGIIFNLVRSEHFIVITSKGFHSSTPKMGHKRYWQEAADIFKMLKKNADKRQGNF